MSEEAKKVRGVPFWLILAGAMLVLIGLIKVLEIPMEKVWPYLLIALGVAIIAYALLAWAKGEAVLAEKYE